MNKSGPISGLYPQDLSIEQLKKVNIPTLVQCVDLDERVVGVIEASFNAENIKQMLICASICGIYNERLIEAYNKFLTETPEGKGLFCSEFSYRDDYIRGSWLRGDLKYYEYKAFTQPHTTRLVNVIGYRNMDYEYLREHFPEYYYKIANRAITFAPTMALRRFSGDLIEVYWHKIKEFAPGRFQYLLTNPETPDDKLVWVLKKIRRGENLHVRVSDRINLKLIRQLPAISRLNVLEALTDRHQKSFIRSIDDVEDVNELLAAAMIRYPDRVSNVIQKMKNLKQELEQQDD